MITLSDYFQSRDSGLERDLRLSNALEYNPDIERNAEILLPLVNLLLTEFGEWRKPNSGWRPPSYNAKVPGAAKRSFHMTGQAIDLEDDDGGLKAWLMEYPQTLDKIGLWMEHPSATKGWVHLQSKPPRSNRRIFYP
jgi:hypothetical protein